MCRRQERLIVTHARYISLLLQRSFCLRLFCQRSEQRMTATAGLQPHKGGLNLVDCGYHRTPEGGGRFIQSGFGKRDIAAQPRTLEYGAEQVQAQISEPLLRIEQLSCFRTLQPDGTGQG